MVFGNLHHLANIASAYLRSKAFYTETLGLKVIRETYREARDSWKLDLELADGVQIELFSFPGAPPRPLYPETCGLRHLAFATGDLDAAVAALAAKGVEVEAVRTEELTGKRSATS